METLQIETLGGLRILRGGKLVTGLESRKVEALLVYLVASGQAVNREVLAGLLWGNKGQNEALADLREALSNLRKVLGEYLEITRSTAGLRQGVPVRLDARDLETCWNDAKKTGPLTGGRAVSLADHVLALYQGEFLLGFSLHDCLEFEEWLILERERLHIIVIDAVRSFISEEIRCAKFSAALEHTERLLALDPWMEESYRLKMLLLAVTGQRGAAMTQYELCRKRLADELGVDPAVETIQLYEKIRKGEIVCIPEIGEGWPREGWQTNLPAQTSSFIGRKRELRELTELLRRPETRLVTLTGPGGIGKTRLSLAAAQALSQVFSHGIWFVELDSLAGPDQLLPAIAAVLGVEERGSTALLNRLKDYLRSRQILLVLDNFEHLLAAAGNLTGLLKSAPGLKILVTSRQRLHLYGEFEYNVEPMQLPLQADCRSAEELVHVESVLLFTERGQAARASFKVTNANAPVIAAILRQLEGLPLAIELAAARLKMMGCEALLSRLENRFDVLQDGPVDITFRQQTMRSTIEWSYLLLDPLEQALFRKLGVFVGGWSLDAAAAVCAASEIDVPAVLESLTEKSLVQSRPGKDRQRFGMLETIREYALEKLAGQDDLETLREQHAVYFRGWLNHPPEGVFYHLPNLDEELDNIEIAFQWMLTRDRPEALLLGFITSFYKYYASSLTNQAIVALERAMAVVAGAPVLDQAYAYNLSAYLCVLTGQYQHWEEYALQSLRLARQVSNHPNLLQCGLLEAGRLFIRTGRLAEAEAVALEGMRISQGYYTPTLLTILGDIALFKEDLIACREYYQEGLRLVEQLPDWNWGWIENRWYCASLDAQLGDLASARLHIQKIYEIPKLKEFHLFMLKELQAQIYLEENLVDLARPLLEEIYQYYDQAGMLVEAAKILLKFAQLALLQNDPARAARILGAAERINAGFRIQFQALDAFLLRRIHGQVLAHLSLSTFEIARGEGYMMNPREKLELIFPG